MILQLTGATCQSTTSMAYSHRQLAIGFLFGMLIFIPISFKYITSSGFSLPAAFLTRTVLKFNKLQGSLKQDDPRLLALLRTRYLIPPANKTFHLMLTGNGHSDLVGSSPVARLVQKLLGNKRNGFFVECGALDGVFLSNSLELERNFNWTGVLVEADPKYRSALIATNRKAWILAPVCLSPKPYPMRLKMRRHIKDPGLSTIAEYHPNRETILGMEKAQWQEFKVQCFPLYSVLLALNLTEIDYLSLDVEGAEWSIIQTIPFDKVKIKVIGMEFKSGVIHHEAIKYLKSLGYKYLGLQKGPGLEDGVFAHASILKPAT